MTLRHSILVYVMLCIMEVSFSVADETCTKMEGRTDLQKTTLRKSLLCNYDQYSAPINESNGNRVHIEIALSGYRINHGSKTTSTLDRMRTGIPELDENSPNWFTMTTYVIMSWIDPRLKWNTSDYNNESLVQFDYFEIWEPRISNLYQGHDGKLYSENDGTVTSISWSELIGFCRPVSYSWGEQHDCTLQFRVGPEDKVQLSRNGLLEVDFHASNSASWGVVKAERIFPPKPGTKNDKFSKINEEMPWKYGPDYFESKVILQRNYAVTDATIFAPAAILLILLFSTTLIPANDESRVAMLSVILVAQVFMFHRASQSMPVFEQGIVKIVELYQNLIVCSGVATVEWLVAYIITQRKAEPAMGTISRTSVFPTLRTVFAIPAQDSRNLETALLLDRITFIFLAITSFILVVIEARRPPSVPYDRTFFHTV